MPALPLNQLCELTQVIGLEEPQLLSLKNGDKVGADSIAGVPVIEVL